MIARWRRGFLGEAVFAGGRSGLRVDEVAFDDMLRRDEVKKGQTDETL